ncbi:MAG: NAD(P)H-dependent oxidoreductase [Fimbriimonadaceae bacterium]|nr:NAD(P)H-dependent oxidoreductase [Chitinophagales bacterium]
MKKVLVIFAHPMLEKSLTQIKFIEGLKTMPHIFFHDLYQTYPDFDVDVEFEKELLLNHDVIVWQHPFYWYSSPPLLKQWIDLVLEHGWAYGKDGIYLKGKMIFNAITTGGPNFGYEETGFNKHTIRQFLAPFEQTAILCNMHYLPPFVMHGTHRASQDERIEFANSYKQLLTDLTVNKFYLHKLTSVKYLNELIPSSKNQTV